MKKEQKEELKKKIEYADIVSFDLYDTLIFRETRTARDVFLYLEKAEKFSGFYQKRIQKQRAAYHRIQKQSDVPHPTLHEIYEFWKKEDVTVSYMEDAERKLEIQIAFRNQEMWSFLQYAKQKKKRVIITTDMYLERETIEKIIKKCDVTGWDKLYLSSEQKEAKYNGTMYDKIIACEHVRPEKLLHIGDNKQDDIKEAEKRHIATFYYMTGKQEKARELYSRYRDRKMLKTNENAFWYMLGYQIGGPLYIGMLLWVKENIGRKKLYCLSRDGYNLVHLAEKFQVFNAEYIYSSRRALLLPHIQSLDTWELELLPPYSCGQTIAEIFSYLGFDKIPEEDLKEQGFVGREAVIKTKRDIKKLKTVYKKNRKYILGCCERERQNWKRYIQQQNCIQKEMIFFDSGWNGTSQYLFQKIYAVCKLPVKLTFYYMGIRFNRRSRSLLYGTKYKSFVADFMTRTEINHLLSAASVLELFFSENAPPLLRYGEKQLEFEKWESMNYTGWINQGIEDYVTVHQKELDQEYSVKTGELAIAFLMRLVTNPTTEEARYIGRLENTDSISSSSKQKKYLARLPRASLKENIFLDIYWEKGVYHYPANTVDVKLFVFFRQRISELMSLWEERKEKSSETDKSKKEIL